MSIHVLQRLQILRKIINKKEQDFESLSLIEEIDEETDEDDLK